ncbi:MAG TPA: L-seryl-tRNA(Sec) selenium transferase [Tepidisphaeraceae bacterium]|jgi:L-seryl-tRNA(Ser) seleniumtransferase
MGHSPKAAAPESLRAIPSVDRVLRELGLGAVDLPRSAVVALVRRELAVCRTRNEAITTEQVMGRIRAAIDDLRLARIQPVINGTGVIIHTNLGRSPLGPMAVDTLTNIASNYNNLEFDLRTGDRGGRATYLEHNLAVLCEAEAATVVNNCAAALVLILRHFTAGERKQVLISRGELVQIGGGFRIPEILEASGAILNEVGATNKTTIDDYARAVSSGTAMILKVHQSNFYMVGFVDCPSVEELAQLAQAKGLPLVEDLGSGATFATERTAGVDHEPTPTEVLRRGADLVCFSGDKLFGGPQAGIIAGRSTHVAALKREPFFRALRCDKLILSALQTTVDLHLTAADGNPGAGQEIPIIAMLQEPIDKLQARADQIASRLDDLPAQFTVGSAESTVGGGTLPKSAIPSVTVDILPHGISLEDFAARLRAGKPPVVGTISNGRFRIDLRTVFPRQDGDLRAALRAAFSPSASSG